MSTFFTFLFLSLFYCAAPDPTMLMVINTGLSSQGKEKLFFCIAGVMLSNFTAVILISFGVGAFIKDSQYILSFIKYTGTAYLLYLGIRSLIGSFRKISPEVHNKNKSKISFSKGFLTSITNPKLLLFYIAFLPQFYTRTFEYNIELFVWGLLYNFIVFCIMSTYGIMASSLSEFLKRESIKIAMQRVIGVSFIIFGISLLKFKQT